jgi:hypothetical protein
MSIDIELDEIATAKAYGYWAAKAKCNSATMAQVRLIDNPRATLRMVVFSEAEAIKINATLAEIEDARKATT